VLVCRTKEYLRPDLSNELRRYLMMIDGKMDERYVCCQWMAEIFRGDAKTASKVRHFGLMTSGEEETERAARKGRSVCQRAVRAGARKQKARPRFIAETAP